MLLADSRHKKLRFSYVVHWQTAGIVRSAIDGLLRGQWTQAAVPTRDSRTIISYSSGSKQEPRHKKLFASHGTTNFID
jgi:hypothetical protein